MDLSSTAHCWVVLSSHLACTVTWTHHGEDLGEALTVPGNSLRGLSEWQSLPSVVVSCLAVKVYDSFLTWGTVRRADILLGEHRIVFTRLLVLTLDDEIIEILDVFLDSKEFLLHRFLIREHFSHLLEHFVQSLKETLLKLFQVSLLGFLVEITLHLRQLASDLLCKSVMIKT